MIFYVFIEYIDFYKYVILYIQSNYFENITKEKEKGGAQC